MKKKILAKTPPMEMLSVKMLLSKRDEYPKIINFRPLKMVTMRVLSCYLTSLLLLPLSGRYDSNMQLEDLG